ncbi:pollen receptor-like protein kinase 1 [Cinnamomum micranthum f. kanehirae]|uniref:Pollen receptor-like protein kinase 1 n=1 Tax=Cinnamomum micranthum f. kanehirae TaxID=337451 RepID=A0A443PLF2_9MAGN|nr:pollen receptor-like protein kinase 1 [Cinnamomum micranthum f. kanehirae]
MDHNHHLWHLSLLIISLHVLSLHVSGASETTELLKLKGSLGNTGELHGWALDSIPCHVNKSTWKGVICENGAVFGLRLENMSLTGHVDMDALIGLPGLRMVSFQNNSLQGSILDQLGKLGPLRLVFLSDNQFSGVIPANAFEGKGSLRRVHLSRNKFSGPIPVSLTGLSKLVELKLDGNQFTGEIPDFPQQDLQLDVSNNELEGPIPADLSKMNSGCFAGNKNLCGAPLKIICKPDPDPHKISIPLLIVLILVGVAVALAVIGGIFFLISRRRRKKPLLSIPPANQKKAGRYNKDLVDKPEGEAAGGEKGTAKDQDPGKLVFVKEDREQFELNDLLRASAEVLGNGSFGPSYKALLLSGSAMVVKRLKEMNGVGREEFHHHMRRLGRLRHPNLLPLVAYYYRKEEKLLVSDYVANGSLAQQLHGNRSLNRRKLDWQVRLKIVKGVANGLAYLYNEFPNQILPHGHLKSSNVLLDASFEPLLVDYALAPVINKEHAIQHMVAYKSPEYTEHSRVARKSDVWSLGILILEMLTGKLPSSNHRQGKGGGSSSSSSGDLATWVNSVVREEWTGEVFDSEIEATGMALKLLQIGLGCCERDVQKRWNLREVMERIEELRGKDSEDDYSSISEGNFESSGMTDDDFSFSRNV